MNMSNICDHLGIMLDQPFYFKGETSLMRLILRPTPSGAKMWLIDKDDVLESPVSDQYAQYILSHPERVVIQKDPTPISSVLGTVVGSPFTLPGQGKYVVVRTGPITSGMNLSETLCYADDAGKPKGIVSTDDLFYVVEHKGSIITLIDFTVDWDEDEKVLFDWLKKKGVNLLYRVSPDEIRYPNGTKIESIPASFLPHFPDIAMAHIYSAEHVAVVRFPDAEQALEYIRSHP